MTPEFLAGLFFLALGAVHGAFIGWAICSGL